MINPARISVVNIVPGNRRRRMAMKMANAAREPWAWRRLLANGTNITDDGTVDDEGVDVDWEVSARPPRPCSFRDGRRNRDVIYRDASSAETSRIKSYVFGFCLVLARFWDRAR